MITQNHAPRNGPLARGARSTALLLALTALCPSAAHAVIPYWSELLPWSIT